MNPHKLEPFFEARRLKAKEESALQDVLAWQIGKYVTHSIATCFNKKASYPSQPDSVKMQEELAEHDGETKHEAQTDGDKFKLFMVKHNKNRRAKRAKE